VSLKTYNVRNCREFYGSSKKKMQTASYFLILHYHKDIVLKYQVLCDSKNHFDKPLHEEDYMPLIRQILPNYSKSSLPKNFEISKTTLENLFENNRDDEINFRSGFVKVLRKHFN
jgi:hypothetical protein